MSFRFNWPEFEAEFIQKASRELENALNRGKKPSNICDLIRVKELFMGTVPPELDILEIGEVSLDRFRGIFKLAYSGDGYLVLETKVQANPLNFSNYTACGESVLETGCPSSPFLPSNPSILAADCPLIVPMQLKISLMRLRAIVVLIVSRTTGITLSFKTDPLESVLVSSTFDALPSVRRHLQAEIENRLRDLFQKEIPAMVHLLSNEWLKTNRPDSRTVGLDDYLDAYTSPPDSMRALSPTFTSVTGKYSAPLPVRVSTPKSYASFSKTVSIAAQSAPAHLEKEVFDGQIQTVIRKRAPMSQITPLYSTNNYPLPQVINHRCHSEFGFTGAIPNDQHYFRNIRNIIVRAPTDIALPDPVLIDSGNLFKRKPFQVSKMFRSLFKIPEADREDASESKPHLGLKAVGTLGLIDDSKSIDSGSVRSYSQSPMVIAFDNCSVRSRSRSALMDPTMNRAFSTISGNRFTRSINPHSQHDRCLEIDPDLVQFEPDEFRSDYRTSPILQPSTSLAKLPTTLNLNGSSKTLSVKFGIMRRLQNTLSPKTFEESNVLYRSMSKSSK